MRLMLSRCRIVVGLAFLCCGSGCLEFEKQSMVFFLPKDGKEIRALFVYHGLQVDGGKGNLERAKKKLARLACGKDFYVAFSLFRVPLVPDDAENVTAESKKTLETLNRHLTVQSGFFVPRMDGYLAFCQLITVKQPAQFVTWLNQKISAGFSGEIELDKDSLLDRQTLEMAQKAARDGHAWLQLEPGRLRFTMPGTPQFFAKVKTMLVSPFLQWKKPEAAAEEIREEGEDFWQKLTYLAETPWNLEQKPKQLTLAVGWGDGLPFRVIMGHGRRPVDSQQNKDLLAHAQTLGVPFRKDVSISELLDEFERTGKVK